MRRIVVATFTSLDGVMQAPGGPQEDPSGGFTLGGWTAPHFDEAGGAFVGDIFGRPYDLLLGRKTYDIFAAHWPHITDPNDRIATVFNRVTKYVASRSSPKLGWQGSQLLGRDVVAALRTLKGQDGPDLLVWGSSDLLQTLWRGGLGDRNYWIVFPGVVGQGQRIVGCRPKPGGAQACQTAAFQPP